MKNEWIDGRTLSVNELSTRYELPREEVQSFWECIRIYRKGDEIITEGDTDRTLFVLRSGRVAVYKQVNPSGRERIATIEAINMFGEMSLLNDDPRSATVIADSSDVVVYGVGRPNIQVVLSNPRWAEMLVTRLSRDLAQADQQFAALRQALLALEAEKAQVELDLVAARQALENQTAELVKAFSVLIEVQRLVAGEAVVGTRGWALLQALDEVTRLLLKKNFPAVAAQTSPVERKALYETLVALGWYGQSPLYKTLLETLAKELP
jgi:CRP-like cAMP-binding protein